MKFLRFILIATSIGLMIASSGLDGSYLSRAMGPWFGYTLNTVSDIVSEVLMYAFARIRQTAQKNSKAWKLSRILIVINVLIVAYAWFFGWRELLIVLPAIEGSAAGWVSLVMAGFVPIGILGAGVAQALIDGKVGDTDKAQDDDAVKQLRAELKQARAELAQARTLKDAEFTDFVRVYAEGNGALHKMAPSDGNAALVRAGFAPLAESTWRNWRDKMLQEAQL